MSSVSPPSFGSGVAAPSSTVSPAALVENPSPLAPAASTLSSASAPESQNCLEQLWTSIASLVSSLWNAVMGFFCRASVPAHVEAITVAPTIPEPFPAVPAIPQTLPPERRITPPMIPQGAPVEEVFRPNESIARRSERFITETLAQLLRTGFQTVPYKAALLIQVEGEILSVRGRELDSAAGADELIRSSVDDLRDIERFIHESSSVRISLILLQDKTGGTVDTRDFSRVVHSRGSQNITTGENTTWLDPSSIPQTLIASHTGMGTTNQAEYQGLARFFMETNPMALNIRARFL
ncbi:MAG TPA: hypothetical protein VIJ46_03575 [Rhabdochlamydiaceae bacterium]